MLETHEFMYLDVSISPKKQQMDEKINSFWRVYFKSMETYSIKTYKSKVSDSILEASLDRLTPKKLVWGLWV